MKRFNFPFRSPLRTSNAARSWQRPSAARRSHVSRRKSVAKSVNDVIVSAESGHVPTREIVVVVRDLGTTIGVGTDRFLTTENATADNAEAREQVIELVLTPKY